MIQRKFIGSEIHIVSEKPEELLPRDPYKAAALKCAAELMNDCLDNIYEIMHTIILIGHSLSEVDMEYFEKIRSVVHSDAKWVFSCHDFGGLKAINAFVKTMAIGADRATIFRL